MNQNMKRLDGLFGRRNDFGIASFSIDPDHDTPTVLKQYASLYEVESPHWHFLTGEKPTIFELANSGLISLQVSTLVLQEALSIKGTLP